MRACQRCQSARRIGRPEILANLDAKGEALQIARCKDLISAKGHVAPCQLDRQPDAIAPMAEMALFIKLAVIGQIALGDHAQNLPARDHNRAIVNAGIAAERCTDHQHRPELFRCRAHFLNRRFSACEHRLLQMQIINRISGQAKLRVNHQIDMRLIRALRLGNGGSCVERNISGAQCRCGCGNPHKPMRVHVVERVRTCLLSRCSIRALRCIFQPVFRLANAQFGELFLHRRTRNLALRLPAIDRARGPWIAIFGSKFLGRQRGFVRLAPLANFDTC